MHLLLFCATLIKVEREIVFLEIFIWGHVIFLSNTFISKLLRVQGKFNSHWAASWEMIHTILEYKWLNELFLASLAMKH